MKRLLLITLCIITLASCGLSQKPTQDDNANTRWPDFLRDWAADYEIDDAQRLAIIDQIDTLYRLVEDSTSDNELLCSKLCQLQNTISDAIVHDSSLVFPLMMRATARSFYGKIANNPWLFDLDCECNILGYLVADAVWYTSNRKNFDLMYTTIIGLSWQAPERFANLMLSKEDGSELSTALLIVYNYTDAVIDNLQVSFTDSAGNVLQRLTESDVFVDTPDAGVKQMMLPPYLVMNALAAGGTMTISFDTPQGTLEMVGFPHVHFMEQIEDCPRLKAVLDEALSVQIVPMDDDIKSKIGQPIKQVINRNTGEVIELDGTYYLDTVWSEELGSYILDIKQK